MAQEEWKSCHKKIEMIWPPEKDQTPLEARAEDVNGRPTSNNALFGQEISQEVDEFMGNNRLGRAN
jgi:hypothetical protein